jgi:hypothetical protein
MTVIIVPSENWFVGLFELETDSDIEMVMEFENFRLDRSLFFFIFLDNY